MSSIRPIEITGQDPVTIGVSARAWSERSGERKRLARRATSMGYTLQTIAPVGKGRAHPTLRLTGPDVINLRELSESIPLPRILSLLRYLGNAAFEQTKYPINRGYTGYDQAVYDYTGEPGEMPIRVLDDPYEAKNPLSYLLIAKTLRPGIDWAQQKLSNPDQAPVPLLTQEIVDSWEQLQQDVEAGRVALNQPFS